MTKKFETARVGKAVLSVALATVAFSSFGSSVPARAEDTLKIGVILPLSGPAAGIGQEDLLGIRYALDEMGGKVAGKTIEFDIADDQNSPNDGLSETRRLVENDKVIAVIGTLNSAVALAIHPYTSRAKIPYITGGIAADLTGARKSEYTFRGSVAAGQTEVPLAHFLYARGLKRGILMGSDYAAGHDAVHAVGDNLKKEGGTVAEEMYPRQGETDYAPYFSRLPGIPADFVYGYFFGGDTLRFVRQYASLGSKLPLVMTAAALSTADVAQNLGEAVNGVLSPELWWVWTLTDPATKTFIERYTKLFGKSPQTISIDGYIKAEVVLKALEALHGEVKDSDTFAAAIKKVQFPMPGGGTFRFDENNNPIVNIVMVQWEWKDGKANPKVLDQATDVHQVFLSK